MVLNELQVYIACAGLSTRVKPNKLLTKFRGNTLPSRQVKLLNNCNIIPTLILNQKNGRSIYKQIYGRFRIIYTYTEHKHNVDELISLFEIGHIKHNFLYLCGDLYYIPQALNKMLNYSEKLTFFGRSKTDIYSDRPEIFAFKANLEIHKALYIVLKSIVNQSLWEIPNRYHYPIIDIDECLDYDSPEDKLKIEEFIRNGDKNKDIRKLKRHLLNFFEIPFPRRMKGVMRKW